MRRPKTAQFFLSLLMMGGAVTISSNLTAQPQATVDFANSCSPQVQEDFAQAVTLLHSFEYPETTRLFAKIIKEDPTCAMARWGAAMSIWHPLWAPPSRDQLAEGMDLLKNVDDLPATPRESAYLDAVQAFFSSNDPRTHLERALAYQARMEKVYSSDLDDPEAALFYALSLLATASPQDKSYANQFKSAGLLNWVRESQPTHPGVLHYLIHSYDYPGLAHLALEAAKIYAEAAPNSAHAQHMPSHIFTRLGLWDRSLSSNQDSTRSAAEYTRRAHLPGHYDEGLHSMDYLMYAMLQTARDEEARSLLGRLHSIEKTDPENFKVAFAFAASPARYALERRAWQEASELTLYPATFDWSEFGWALAIHHFARGFGAARLGAYDQATAELKVLREIRQELPATTLPYWREEVSVKIDALQSWIVLGQGDVDEGLKLASAAADREDAVDKHPVTPGEVIPARELYAEMLFETGRHQAALSEFQKVLDSAPNRLNALVGGIRAARTTGNRTVAAEYVKIVAEQTKEGNQQRPSLKGVLE